MEDKRAAAMRQAIAEADKKRGGSGSSGKKPRGEFFGKAKAKVAGWFNTVKNKIVDLWTGKRYGKPLLIGAGILVVILLTVGISTCSKKPAPTAVYELKTGIINVYSDPDSESGYSYDGYVEITNTGVIPFYINDVVFRIKTGGTVVLSDRGVVCYPALILPGETGVLFNRFRTNLPVGVSGTDVFNLAPSFTVVASSADKVSRFGTEDFAAQRSETGVSVTGRVINNTDKTRASVVVAVIAYDSEGRCVGFGSTVVNNLSANASEDVLIESINMVRSWRNSEIDHLKVYAY